MKGLIFLIILNIPISGISQSFVFCPKFEVENEINIEGSIFLVYRDSRTYEKKLKEKCSKEEVLGIFTNYIETTYPKLKITVLGESQYTEKPVKDQITFKIDLKRYDATFYTGMYVSYTKFLVEIHDLRNGNNIMEYEFNGKGSQWNAGGYSSGKKASNNSFKRAISEFILIIEKVINGKIEQPADIALPSKADRLRELKQLLDEGILTQEEFENEKKKILDEN